jgi:hypothetical protein
MKTTGIRLATALFAVAVLCGAEPDHRMKVLRKQGAMSEALGKGKWRER